jgi:pyruvate dehydrogenase E1 component alpha subunit
MWASAAGEEAPLVAIGQLATADDWIYPGHRDIAIALARGIGYDELARQVTLFGPRVAAESVRIAPTTDALGMHLVLAAGHAHANKLAGNEAITFALLGEGTTTAGTFHEAAMLAVHGDLPVVFVCRSQLWPNGAPAEAGLVGDSVAERARLAGLWVRRVDGADPLAVYEAIATAAARARSNRGPALVEAVVTRLHADVPAHRDPLERLRRYLDRTGSWTQTFQDVVEAEVGGYIEKAFDAARTHAVVHEQGGRA